MVVGMHTILDSNHTPLPPQRTLLYVEDNAANMALVQQLIARRGDLKLLTAIEGNIGIMLARAYQPEVILMDINLPGISGFDALRILQEDAATSHIPVIALSSSAYPRDIANGIKAGFFQYVTKPYNINEFLNSLDAALLYAAKNLQPVQSSKTV
jgi:CheY-like chemotaxis protein